MTAPLLLILCVLAFNAEGSEPITEAPTIGIDKAIALAVESAKAAPSNPAYYPKALYCRSAILTDKPDFGLVWILEFECMQPPTPPLVSSIKVDVNSLITPWFFEARINMKGEVDGYCVARYKEHAKHDVPIGTPIPTKKGFCMSPYSGVSAGYMDVRACEPGDIIRCPYTGLPMVIPQPVIQ